MLQVTARDLNKPVILINAHDFRKHDSNRPTFMQLDLYVKPPPH